MTTYSQPTIVFLTALPLEYEAVVAYLENRVPVEREGKRYEMGNYTTPRQVQWQVVIRQQAIQGNIQAALETQKAMNYFQPVYLFFVGIAAKIKDVDLGDVVAATLVKGYEAGKMQENKLLSRPLVAHASKSMSEIATYLARGSLWQAKIKSVSGDTPKAIVAPIVSGEKVIDSEEFLNQLKQDHSDAAAVEMEGLGFLQAVNDSVSVPGIVIRGISDAGANKSQTDKLDWRDKAARHAAAFAFAILDELVAPVTQPVPPPVPVSSAIFQVPIPRNDYFTGRIDLLQQLQETLPKQPVALSGLGGMGKTQIAVEYAYRQQAKYSAIFWLNASNEVVLHTGVSAIAKELGLNAELPAPDLRAVVKLALSKRRDWLLIVDNADELSILKLVLNEVLPRQLTGHVLVTTRHSAPPAPLKRLLINRLTDDQGAELLLRRTAELSDEFSQHPDYAAACQLSQTLNGLPLALAQAAAYLYKRQCGYPKYLSLYQRQAARLLQERGELLFDDDHPLPVATTWQVSLDQIQQQQPRALELLDYCAFLAPAGIPEAVLQAVLGIEEFDLEDLLDPILSYSLLTHDAGSQQVQIHGLVQTVLREKLAKEKQRRLVEELVTVVVVLFPDPGPIENWPACERLVPSALACAEGIERYQIESESAGVLLNRTAYYLHIRKGDYDQALPLYQRALAIREQVLGPAHPDYATSLNNLAMLYHAKGNYDQALPLCQRASSIWEQVLGHAHPDYATSLNNLAMLHKAKGDYDQALPLSQRALAIYEQVLGPAHPNYATSLLNLAALYESKGKYDQALPLYERALAIREQALGPAHPAYATSLNNLAGLYWAKGDYDQALPLSQRALAIDQQVYGEEHPDMARHLNNLALLYKTKGDYDQALPLYQQASSFLEKVLGPTHPLYATSLNNLAGLYHAKGDYDQALPLFQRALAIDQQVYGEEHPDVARDLNNLAMLYDAKGDYDQALPLSQRTLAIDQQVYGEEHPAVARDLNNLAGLYRAKGDYDQALPLYERAVTILKKTLGTQHSNTRLVTANYLQLLGLLKIIKIIKPVKSWWQRVKQWVRGWVV